jgi:transmembrane sensor
MEHQIPWDIIVRDLKGQATPEEVASLNHWLENDIAHVKILSEIHDVYRITAKLPPVFNPDKEHAWKRINRQTGNSRFRIRQMLDRLKYAAAALVLFMASFTFFLIYQANTRETLHRFTEVIAPLGQKSMVVLPDGSSVWLNSGSSLKYQGNFNIREREVFLNGEAFFDVRKDEAKKFRVQAGILTVNVYGTSFNVKNYEDDVLQEITVSEGMVGISDKRGELKQLTPGLQAVFNKNTKKISFIQANPEVVSSWKYNELKFDNTPFTEVIKYLERWYGVNIKIDPSMVGKHNYTFRIKTESLTEMLEKIRLMTPINYNIDGKDVVIKYTN